MYLFMSNSVQKLDDYKIYFKQSINISISENWITFFFFFRNVDPNLRIAARRVFFFEKVENRNLP